MSVAEVALQEHDPERKKKGNLCTDLNILSPILRYI